MRRIPLILLLCCSVTPVFAQDVSAVSQASQKFASALSAGDASSAAAMFTDDGYLLPPGRKELKSKPEIQMYLGALTRAVQNLQYTTVDVQPIGDSAAREVGSFSFKTKGRQGAGPQDVSGKYLLLWVKSGGDWKISAEMWSRNGPGPGQGRPRGGARRGGAAGEQPE